MKIRHVGRAAALCVAILACTPTAGRPAELTDRVSSIEPARGTVAESSPLVTPAEGGGLTVGPVIPFASDGEWRGKGNPGVDGEPSMRVSMGSQSLARSIATEVARLKGSTLSARLSTGVLQANSQNRNWIQRHPVLFGTLVGFGAGFLVGYLPGDDTVFYDFTAEFNGLVLGGVGAGAGALVGWAVSR